MLDTKRIDFIPEALELARIGILPEGMYRNRSFAEQAADLSAVDMAVADLLFDPQTSGGLLIAVDPADADVLYEELKTAVPSAQRIGTVCEPGDKRIVLR